MMLMTEIRYGTLETSDYIRHSFCFVDEAIVVTENRRGFTHQGACRGELAQRFHAKRLEQHRSQSRRRDPRRRDGPARGWNRWAASPKAETQGSSASGRSTLGARRLHAQDHLHHRKCMQFESLNKYYRGPSVLCLCKNRCSYAVLYCSIL